MFITGPDVIKTVTHEEVTKEALGGARDARAARAASATSPRPTTQACIARMRELLSSCRRTTPKIRRCAPTQRSGSIARSPRSTRWCPPTSNKPYDIKDVIRAVVDDGHFFEVHERYAQNIVVGFARIGGAPVGIVANQPMCLAGCLDIDACIKAARFVRFCDCFNIPLVTFVDVPGFLPGTDQEYGGIIKHGAKLLFAFAEATVPKITVITRKAYGGAYDVMASKHIRADVNFAFPTAEIAVMGPDGAVNIVFRQRDREGRRSRGGQARKFVDEYRERFANPYKAAELGFIDEVIHPRDARQTPRAARSRC